MSYYIIRSREDSEYYMDDWGPDDKESLVKELSEAEANLLAGRPESCNPIEYIFEAEDDMCLAHDPKLVQELLDGFEAKKKKQAIQDKRDATRAKTIAKKRRKTQFLRLKEEFPDE